MAAASQAAAARLPQVTSLDDPMFGATVAPGGLVSDQLSGGYRVEISQKYPWPGKLGLRGESARAEANAAAHDLEDMRVQLIESAQSAFYDYFFAERALEVNGNNLRLLQEFKRSAATRYQNDPKASQQDELQADVEIARERERRLALEESRQIAVARIDTLLHVAPDSPLPPPPREVKLLEALPDVQVLRADALARRADLRALADRLAAEQAALALAQKEFCPDFEVMAAYDALWQEKELRPQLAVRLNLPVRRAKRYGALAEAEAKVAQRQAELVRQTDEVNLQVQEAYERVRKSERSVHLYQETILTAAGANVKAARAAYETGKTPFLSLIEAQRNEVMLRERYYEALADYFRRRATLDRAVGGPQ
jgi:outer membrane protein TolC